MRDGVRVAVAVRVGVGVRVRVGVAVFVGVRVTVGINVAVGVRVTVGVGVIVGVRVIVEVKLGVTVTGAGGVGVVSPKNTNRTASTPTKRSATVADSSWVRFVNSMYSSSSPVKLYLPM